MQPFSREDLKEGLKQLGIGQGDTVLVRAALKAIGPTVEKPRVALLNALLDLVGDGGTIVGLAFTPTSYRWSPDREHVFRSDAPPVTGAFAVAMLQHPQCHRSRHPTNSFVAVGRRAEEFTRDHDHRRASFSPLAKLVAEDGRMLLVGCAETSPGFSTVHLAQEVLKLSYRTILPLMVGAYFDDGERVRWFTRRDDPGCSRGFSKFYDLYREAGILKSAMVGAAESICVSAPEAYRIELDALTQDPCFALCDRPTCMRCRGNLRYNAGDALRYWLNAGPSRVFREVRARMGSAPR
jgi:aminoglycoside N3'-acetyltransferase